MKIIKYINKILPLFERKKNVQKFKNVLVVSNTGLGDTILGTPAIKTLRKSFPELNITFLINKKMYPLFKGFSHVDDFLLYSTGILNQIKLIIELRKKKIDTIFLFHSNGPEDIFFSILSGANNILKMTDNINHEYKNVFLNEIKKTNNHVIESKIDLVRIFKPKIIDIEMEMPNHYMKNKNNKINKENNIFYIGLQMGAQDSHKMWPIDKFIKLSNILIKKNIKLVIFGATDLEIKLTNQLIEKTDKSKIINICAKSSIQDLPYWINNLDLLITNDTGTMHLSIALNIPTISLFGPTDSKKYGPYQNLEIHDVIQKDGFFVNNVVKKKRTNEGMDLIEVDEVVELVNRRLFEKKALF